MAAAGASVRASAGAGGDGGGGGVSAADKEALVADVMALQHKLAEVVAQAEHVRKANAALAEEVRALRAGEVVGGGGSSGSGGGAAPR